MCLIAVSDTIKNVTIYTIIKKEARNLTHDSCLDTYSIWCLQSLSDILFKMSNDNCTTSFFSHLIDKKQ